MAESGGGAERCDTPKIAVVTPTASARRLSSFHTATRSTRGNAITPVRLPFSKNAGCTSAIFTPRERTSVDQRKSIAASQITAPKMSDEALAEMYSNTIKLCQENKINVKNTWSLNLIDYMSMLVKNQPEDSEQEVGADPSDTNFQVAGVTLDAGVRIYCSRVDSVHINAFQVLGSLSRTTKTEKAVSVDESEYVGDEESGEPTRRKARTHRSGGNTLESKLENITVGTLESDLAVDPLFQKMSAAFDEGGARGMLLNNLSINSTYEVVFDSNEPAYCMPDDCSVPLKDDHACETAYDVSNLIPFDSDSERKRLCPRFLEYYSAHCSSTGTVSRETASTTLAMFSDSNFETDDSPSFDYDDYDIQSSAILGTLPASSGEFSKAYSVDRDVAAEVSDTRLEDEDDVSVLQYGPQQRTSDASRESNPFPVTNSRLLASGAVDLVEAGLSLRQDSEYAFFDVNTLKNWAGPEHWRFRPARAEDLNGSQEGSENKDPNFDRRKRARGKTAMLLDFANEAPNIDFAAEFAPAKRPESIQLSSAVREGLTERRVTLPEDLHYKTEKLAALFLKPKIAVVAKRKRLVEPNPQAAEIVGSSTDDWYDFDNDGDNGNYFEESETNIAFDFENDTQEHNTSSLNDEASLQGDLVPQPTRVEKVDIGYATVAKKVDVGELKSGLWRQLRGRCRENTPESDNAMEDADVGAFSATPHYSDEDVCAGGHHTLQHLVRRLPHYVPEDALPDVSVSYVFICLLHLANEESLSIAPAVQGSLDDLLITKEKV